MQMITPLFYIQKDGIPLYYEHYINRGYGPIPIDNESHRAIQAIHL